MADVAIHCRADAVIDVNLAHARVDVLAGPGLANVSREHAAAQRVEFVGVLAPPHLGHLPNNAGAERVEWMVVNAGDAQRAERVEDRQLPRAAAGRLAVVPGDGLPLVDVRLLDRLRQAVVIDYGRRAVAVNEQDAAEFGRLT